MIRFATACAPIALAIAAFAPSVVWAQSTGSQTVEDDEQEIVVTGSRITNGVDGFIVPDVPKTRAVLEQEIINRQVAGQSILQTINLIPSVNYTNNDPYGGSGGNLRIRGFPGNRVALLWDGLPLNDTGNYAIFGNQQFDPELIDQVSVNLGTTDVDSPTPSAAGGVVSYRTRLPTKDLSSVVQYSRGTFDYNRFFGVLDSGELTSGGLRAFVSGSTTRYDKFKGPGKIDRTQYNARLYQPLGGNGDFVSVSGHYNENRNNSYNNGTLADYVRDRNFDNIGTCLRDEPTAGVRDNDNNSLFPGNPNAVDTASCTNFYNLRINPSNTGNIRGQGRFTLADGLLLTIDPGYQYTLANGGGTTTISENDVRLRGTTAVAGVDLNGDGDVIDNTFTVRNTATGNNVTLGGVRVYQPSNTRTNRYTALASLIWEVTEQHRLRVAYSYDRGEHRQTGEFGRVEATGNPISVFGGKYNEDARILTADGTPFQNRDRNSVALLNQISGEYFGRFLDDKVTFTAGVRAPFFERQLDQRCFTVIATGNPTCISGTFNSTLIVDPSVPRSVALVTGAVYAPFKRTVKYSPILPSVGASFEFAPDMSVYASYGRNFSSPSTDSLYRAVNLDLTPETTDAFDIGYRFAGRQVQGQVAAYYTDYKNRIVTATDQDPASQTFGTTQDRNVGDATAKGIDAQIAWTPAPLLTLYAFGSYIDTELKENAPGTVTTTPNPTPGGPPIVTQNFLLTKGAQFVETPKYQFGGRAQVNFGPASFAAQVKYVGKRFSTDDNGRTVGTTIPTNQSLIDSRGRTDAYTTIDLDARVTLASLGLENSYLSLNVINVTDKYYLANINTANTFAANPRFSVGAPRTYQATVRFGF